MENQDPNVGAASGRTVKHGHFSDVVDRVRAAAATITLEAGLGEFAKSNYKVVTSNRLAKAAGTDPRTLQVYQHQVESGMGGTFVWSRIPATKVVLD